MLQQNKPLEWHLFEEGADDATWHDHVGKHGTNARDNSQGVGRLPRLHEFILGMVLLYGVAIFLVWQKAEHHIATLENEVAALRDQLAQQQNASDGEADVADAPPQHRFETDHLRFETSARMAALVEPIAASSDTKYQQLHQHFGLPLPTLGDRIEIIVDLPVDQVDPLRRERTLIILSPTIIAKRYGISEEDALTAEVFAGLTQHVLNKAVSERDIKPQWNAMTLAFYLHLQREYRHYLDWQHNPLYLQRRQLAQSRTLDQALQTTNTIREPPATEYQMRLGPTAEEIADPLAEFILTAYGDAYVSLLLDAFEEHTSWETLTPAVFDISAEEFEENWHAYLRKMYP